MKWWTWQQRVFFCDALARPFHASPQAALSGRRIWKIYTGNNDKTNVIHKLCLERNILLLRLLLTEAFYSLPGLPFGAAPGQKDDDDDIDQVSKADEAFDESFENDNWMNSLQIEHSWLFNVHVTHSCLKVGLRLVFLKWDFKMLHFESNCSPACKAHTPLSAPHQWGFCWSSCSQCLLPRWTPLREPCWAAQKLEA